MALFGEWLREVVILMKRDFPVEARYIREYAEYPTSNAPKNEERPYEIIVSLAQSIAVPEKYDYTGDMILDVTIEATCVRSLQGDTHLPGELEERDVPLNDAHRILYWAQSVDLPNQVRLAIPFEGGIRRPEYSDPLRQPDDDLTRVAYVAWWNIEYRYENVDTFLPIFYDDSFGRDVPNLMMPEVNLDMAVDLE